MFFAAPVIRTVARIDMPSTKQPMIFARCSVRNRFAILTIMLDRSGKGKHDYLPHGKHCQGSLDTRTTKDAEQTMAVKDRHAADVAYLLARREALSARIRQLRAEGADKKRVSRHELRKRLGL